MSLETITSKMTLTGQAEPESAPTDKDKPLIDIDAVLPQLTLHEKIALLSGTDFWHTYAVERLGIPPIRLSDGPNGVRGTKFFAGTPSACFPCGTALASTWSTTLLRSCGSLMAEEAKAKGASVILGPTVNMQRSPLGGRGFESFSEDPVLSGLCARGVVQGMQGEGVAACVKHFVGNDQEHERQAVSSIISERALREIYLMPFQLACGAGAGQGASGTEGEGNEERPWAVMTAYNRVNGLHCSESPRLINDILRKEWGWDGLVMSDWYGTYSTAEALNAGLDLEMPGPAKMRGEMVTYALGAKKVSERTIDERVRNVLGLVNRVQGAGVQPYAVEGTNDTPETRAKLREVAAEAIVLLKNDNNILPFDKTKTIAILGSNAKIAAISGGGSASLRPYYAVTPFEGISAQCTTTPNFAKGAAGYKHLPLLSNNCVTPASVPAYGTGSSSSSAGKTATIPPGKKGFLARTYADPPSSPNRQLVEELYVDTADLMLVDYTPVLPASHPNPDEFYMDLHASFTVPSGESGTWDFGLIVCGTCKFFLDGSLVIDNSVDQVPGGTFFGAGTIEKPGHFILEAGRTYSVLIQFGSAATSAMVIPGVPAMRGGGLRLGGVWSSHPAADIENAVRVARDVDQVVIIAGLNSDWECEGYDRSHMSLPGLTDTLISAVAAVNRNTAVVVQSGTPVAMPWINEVGAVAQAWYGGNETGNGIADVLFGGVCPSGKLPLSFPVRNEDNPAFLNFRSERGRVLYGEDVYVGYRFYEATQKEVLFPFGHGLSYTSFELSGVKLEEPADAEDVQLDSTLSVEVTVKNTGAKEGAEVVQMYVSQKAPSINRPPKELKGFAKVFLKPGEEKTVKVECEMKYATSFWDEERDQWISEMGEYEVLVGNSSAHTPLKEKFVVGETRWWSGV